LVWANDFSEKAIKVIKIGSAEKKISFNA